MRGKQLLGIFLMALVLSAMAAAAGPQLTTVSVRTQDNTTTITIRASGAFTHTEYRPSDNLLLVDLPGVAAGVLQGQSQSMPGPVAGYRVESFQGTGGTDVARVELALRDAPFVTFNQDQGALEVRVTAAGTTAAASAAPPAPARSERSSTLNSTTPDPTSAAPAPPASQAVQSAPASSAEPMETTPHQSAKMDQPVWVRSVNVIHGSQGIELEIRSNGALKPTVTRISDPERIVVDLENARTLRPVQVPVKSDDIKDVRMALYQVNPPVTRVVVDLESARDYELIPSERGLRMKLRPPAQVASLGAPPVPSASAQTMPVLPKAPAVVAQPAAADSTPQPASDAAAASREPAKEVARAMPPANPAAAIQPASAASAQDFVVVQPTYKPKAEADEPTLSLIHI